MAQVLNRAHATLLSLLVVSACAQGIESSPADDSSSAGAAGSTADGGSPARAGASATAGSSSAGAPNGGATGSAGAPSGGSSSGGSAGAAQLGGSSSGGSSAGASTTAGSSMGGSATAGASAAGQGGASAGTGGKAGGGAGGKAGGGGGGASAGSGGGAAACSGTKPESNCVCHTNNAHDYWFCPTPRTFAVGESNCVSANLHMVKIASAAEDKWVNDTANAASFGEYYLGSTDASTPNTWAWLAGGTFWTGVANGTASGYAHWNTGEPNASGDCLVMQSNFVWDDRVCTDNRTYICD